MSGPGSDDGDITTGVDVYGLFRRAIFLEILIQTRHYENRRQSYDIARR